MPEPFLKPEDYIEPSCPLCDDPYGQKPRPIHVARVIEKLDEYIAAKDVEGALRHIAYWTAEAREGRDAAGELTLLNEKMGVLRNAGRIDEALESAREALDFAIKNGFEGETVCGTTLLNAGTVHSAAGRFAEAEALYERAENVYRATLPPDDPRLGGLLNNKAVALGQLGRFDEALAAYERAYEIILPGKYGKLEAAVTLTNCADLYEMRCGDEPEALTAISSYLLRARALLDDESNPRTPYTAFLYEKCAPAFGHYGWTGYERELLERAKRIYEGT